ncbi:unnamed protein product [Linum trigynum]|uniref:Bromo domain-containing protein n=1 Tax=Linum trigynum TaxID=586398 RepID=A0AAV2GKU6_9ROSI
MGAAETVVTKKILKIKFSTPKVEVDSGASSCSVAQKLSADLSSHSPVCTSQNDKIGVSCSKKRGPSMDLDGRLFKRRKMDRTVKQQCLALLKVLTGHPDGWVFSEPVDPVKLMIPDYFTVISHPMDLGTIKSKLSKNAYASTEEFAADVRLTFDNAMLYNPPSNPVHQQALELCEIFVTRWGLLEDKWSYEMSKYGKAKLLGAQVKDSNCMKLNCPRTPPPRNAILSRNSKPSKEKAERGTLGAQVIEVKNAEAADSCVQKSHKGPGHAHGLVNAKPPMRIVVRKCVTCGRGPCACILQMNSVNVLSDASSDGSFSRDLSQSTDARRMDCPPDVISTSQMSRSDPDSDGTVSASDEDNVCPSSLLVTPITDATSGEDWRSDVVEAHQMSPKRALRAAIIKERFAYTILKAKNKTLLDHGDKAESIKMKREKERLERMHHEEKARIEAQIKEAEAASQRQQELELKEQRQREREAARVAVLKVERSVEIEASQEVLKELEDLSGCRLLLVSPRGCEKAFRGREGGGSAFGSPLSPLERLGLFFKDDETDNVDELLDGDVEDGELLP